MNIDTPSLNSLFSPVDGLEQLQQTLLSDGMVSEEFSDALKESIRQLMDMNEVAGAFKEKGGVQDFSGLLGKSLPKINYLEKDIDLENTLEILANIIKTLDSETPEELSLEGLKLEGLNLEELNFEDKLNNLKISILSLMDETEYDLFDKKDLFDFLEEIEEEITQINELISKQYRISKPTDEISPNQQKEVLETQIDINAPLLEPGKISKLVLTEVKSEIKNESLVQKQLAEDKSLGNLQKNESDTLLQQENAFRKPVQDNPVIVTKQSEKAELLVEIDKPVSRLVADIAMLNKTLITENKTELPPMSKHFSHPQWKKEISERIIWMHKQAIPSAELKLNPRHLGPITIRIDTTQEQTNVAFTTQHAIVKEAIEAAIPKLRDMFSAQQLNLVDVNVSQDNSEQKHSKYSAQMENEQRNDENKESEKKTSEEKDERLMEIVEEIEAGRAIASNGILSIFA